jgi:hypothetical protein
MAQELGKIYIEIAANSTKAVNELNKANKSLGTLELAARRLENTLMGIGAYQVISGIGNAVNKLAEFDKVMTQVGVITNSSREDFDKLQKSALKLGSSTQYTAKQIGELQLEFGRLGFSTKEILDATSATVNLATATGEGLARSAEIAGSTLRAFQLDSKEMGRVTDVMAASLNSSALTLDTFADAIKYVSPVAKATGVSLEETAAMMSVLADAGIKGSQAGTSLRRIFTMLTKDGKPLADRLKDLAARGITLADANDEVGLYAQTALLQLSAMFPKVQELTKEFESAQGSTSAMARAMEDNLATSLTKVGTAWDALILSFSNSKGTLRTIANFASEQLQLMAGGETADIIRFRQKLEAAQKAVSDPNFLGGELHLSRFKSLVEEAKKLGVELNIIANKSGIVTGIYENVRGGLNGPEQNKSALLGIEVIQSNIAKSAAEKAHSDKTSAEELKKQREEYEKLITAANKASEAQYARNMERYAREDFFKERKVTMPGTPSLDAFFKPEDKQFESIFDIRNRQMQTFGDTVRKVREDVMAAKDANNEFDFSFGRLSQSIANTVSNIIAYDEEFTKSIKKVASDVLRANAAQIASWLALKFAKDSATKTPVFATVALAAGIGVISGLLGKEWRKPDVNKTTPRDSSYSRMSGAQNSVGFSGTIKGQDIYLSSQNYNRYNRSTSFIGG